MLGFTEIGVRIRLWLLPRFCSEGEPQTKEAPPEQRVSLSETSGKQQPTLLKSVEYTQ